ncbi:putative membrane protein [Acidovorax sp. 62]|uniref:urate hydroxylase PuuD n=1 Tax=Acidovorax sp. 62 TaxID=2035203 RepID=UPI000C19D2B1|nr:urate hydroxylase PuuD [Acidovorax sp. 62]PIF89856.1 putative membrane protein [Acidovorax sp. 62]
MESYVLDWANLLLRWVHVITAIAWIGSSFYFVFLDSSLTPPEDEDLKKQGVSGELWAVHGGGFYHPVKFAVSPPKLPGHLHWFFWESYSTWLSGFALFTVSYLYSASTYLIDKSRMDWAPATAIAVALGFFVVFWLLYDAICRIFGQKKNDDAIVGALVFGLVCIAAWLACHWFAGRAAFLLVGAMIATAMSANVFFWIIPGQRTVVAQIKAGQPVDPIHGKRGKQRSVHNTYFTLPVLFAMLSNHYSFTWNHPQNWLVLILMMFAGAAIRQFFVMRHGYKLGRNGNPLPYALVGVAVILGAIVWMRPVPVAPVPASAPISAPVSGAVSAGAASATGQNDAKADFAAVQAVLEQRCYLCHGAQVQMKNLRLDSPALVKQNAQAIYQQAVVQKLMPMNNATQITDAERALIGRWFEAGAQVP